MNTVQNKRRPLLSSPVTHGPLPPARATENRRRTRTRGAPPGSSSQAAHRAAQLIARLPIADGLRICLSLADERSLYFPAAALRCHSRLLAAVPQLLMAEAQAALAALAELRGRHRYAAAETLREIYARCKQKEAVEVLEAWLIDPPSNTRRGGVTGAHARVDLETGS